ncbi:MAG: 2OG-Fe(II) oxygenase [Brevundimonas sp.]|uniref:2OG-Fe(II) oxygenase n=1 Tax=Brevundimonas sp. TaxID=1871086 RepID=UPI0030024E88
MFRLTRDYLDSKLTGEALTYRTNAPFPNTCIDDFLPADVLAQVLAALPDPDTYAPRDKTGNLGKSAAHKMAAENYPDVLHNLVQEMNGRVVLEWLTRLTGINALLGDPYMHCGGIHQTRKSGFLHVHADYTYLPDIRLDRRLNVLLYLNPGWKDEWGGHLGLWNADGSKLQRKIAPVANRLCIFNTDDNSLHGHPEPLAAPEGVTRNSLAMYYYTAGRPKDGSVKGRNLSTKYLVPKDGKFVEGQPLVIESGEGLKHRIKNWRRLQALKKTVT